MVLCVLLHPAFRLLAWGFETLMDRLHLHYNNRYTFQYTDRPQGGVEIDLSIPYKKARGEKLEGITPDPHPALFSAHGQRST